MSTAKPLKASRAKLAAPRSPLLRIMYSSVTQTPLGERGLAGLLAQCVANNVRDGITGVLMVDGALNIQYFEGPEAAVKALWQRICQDARHHLIVQLYEEAGMLPRLFGQWAMLHGQASRMEMLNLIRKAYLESDTIPRPAWSLAIAPLVILLDPNYRQAYAKVSL
jgi:Sensors of blue-light using FAD